MIARRHARHLLLLSLAGYVILAGGLVGTVKWWTDHVATEIRSGQVGACERGNQIRAQLAEDNQQAITTTRALLTGDGLSRDQRTAYRDALTRRLARAGELHPFPCHTLR